MLPATQRSIRVAAALLGGLLLFSAACGGTSETATRSSPPESQSVLAEGQADASSLATPMPGPTALPLQRYRYDATLTLTEERRSGEVVSVGTTGRFVSPDRHAMIYMMELADGSEIEQRLVAIGPRVWIKAGPRWRLTSMRDRQVLDLIETAFSPLRSEFLTRESLTAVQDSVQDLYGSPETVNGVRALHYRVDSAGADLLKTFLPPDAFSTARAVAWDLWLARDGGWPVRIQGTFAIPKRTELLNGLGLRAPARWKLVIDVSTPNDPSLMIYPPKVRN